ncbi:SDR family oxidoreductase [Mucilaginibacter glaciei]|uniref:SDR family oxidoreductase n=1 Tax=Mucilaginibacter glaciei TaxID=2772109 RepID=A0A926NPG7_9SPHI|nr:SDR family oxidoreductase [Mucilaginibacter glaciei]MBD1391500.1 SDR family oxidoreductase [Mucilaginibacter glaciei]
MTVSILGCGWFGFALAKSLIADGVEVKGSTTSTDKLTKLTEAGVSPYLIDLSTEVNNSVFFDCDVLIIAIPPKSRSGEGAEYVPKLQRVVDAVNQGRVQKVILISSTGVYADLNTAVDELTDPQPGTPGAEVLFAAEELFRSQTKFKTVIIRFGGLIGPGREPGRFFAGRKDIPNGLAPVNMIELGDCIGVARAIIDKDAFGHTFNACIPNHPPKAEFYGLAAKKAGLEPPEFIAELNEWKMVNSVNVPEILGYRYNITNWIDWLNSN